MGWTATIEMNRATLQRVIVTLAALAGLAERASRLPFPLRLLVLRILRPAEAIASDFVIGMAHDLGTPMRPDAPPTTIAPHGDAGAARLAHSFLALALLLGTMLAQARRFSGGVAPGALNARHDALRRKLADWHIRALKPESRHVFAARLAHDTS